MRNDIIASYTHQNSYSEAEDQPDICPMEQEVTPSAAAPPPFRLRVALRSAPSALQSCGEDDDDDDDDDDGEEEEKKVSDKRREEKTARKISKAKRARHVRFEDEETAVAPPERPGSDPAEDVSDSFLIKREQNIKANKAMVSGNANS